MPRLILVCLAGLMFASCIPPEPDDDLIVTYDPEETVMGEIQQRGVLKIAIPGAPPYGEIVTRRGREAVGFAGDLGTLVAEALGVEPKIVALEPPDILTSPEEGSVDISFPLVPVTEKLVRHFAVVDPFYIAHQRLLVRSDSSIDDMADLDSVVCQYVDQRTGVNVAELNPKARPISPTDPSSCLKDLQNGRVEAISAADWLLFPFVAQDRDLRIVGEDLTTEAYSPVIESGASAWADFVEDVLAEADAEGDWLRLYEKWFGPLGGDQESYPDMTAEEAAALFPSGI